MTRLLLACSLSIAFAGVALAAEKITLSCTGVMRSANSDPPYRELTLPNETLVIDLDQGLLTTSTAGSFSTSNVTNEKIDFEGVSKDSQTVMKGGIDRLTGWTTMTSWQGKKMITNYNLTCKPARPLF